MTRTGQILLFVNVGLSMMFAFWAFGLYRDRVDYATDIKTWADEVQRFQKVLAPGGDDARRGAEARWQLAANGLKAAEERRPQLTKWYADQLEGLRAGAGQVLALAFDKAGNLQMDPATGLPKLTPVLDATGKPIPGLASLRKLGQDYTQAQDALRQALEDSDRALAEIKDL